jgi:hypothetical protein
VADAVLDPGMGAVAGFQEPVSARSQSLLGHPRVARRVGGRPAGYSQPHIAPIALVTTDVNGPGAAIEPTRRNYQAFRKSTDIMMPHIRKSMADKDQGGQP